MVLGVVAWGFKDYGRRGFGVWSCRALEVSGRFR